MLNYPVFISHSKLDNRKSFFLSAFATAGVKAEYEEFEPVESKEDPPWKRIKNHIWKSRATFVTLSEPLLDINYRHTMNWIDFEVGLSSAWNKPVWIFEPIEKPINFAVPYATHHVYYDYQSEDYIRWLVGVLEEGDLKFTLNGRYFTCSNCGLTFTQLNEDMNEFPCPSCRTILHIS
jgi:hypothetical protein